MIIVNRIYKIIFSFLLVTPFLGFARENFDPTWEEMIASSDLIAKVEFITAGTFEANAKLLKTYKGTTEKELLIKGFSHKSSKLNHMTKGSQYIVFLKKEGSAYKVWSPTAGFHKLQKGYVQYNLLQTTRYVTQEFYGLKLFEQFLKAAIDVDEDHSKFYASHIKMVDKKKLQPICAQYLMMLELTGYKEYHPEFLEIINNEDPDSRIALVRYLGVIHTDEARKILITLLDDKDDIVAEEAANQLIFFDKELAGKALLNKLRSTGNINNLLADNGSISQLKLKLVKSLVALDYKPAISTIIPMLYTTNRYLFTLVLDALTELKADGYMYHFENHVINDHIGLYHVIFKHICKHKMTNGKELITNFIKTKDKAIWVDYAYLVSSFGVGSFNDSETRTFLINDFDQMVNSNLNMETKNIWATNFFDYFTLFKVESSKKDIYRIAEKLVDLDFDQIKSNTLDTNNTQLIKINNYFGLELFSEYLIATGDANDLAFLHKLESSVDFSQKQRKKVMVFIAKLESKINSGAE